ncbi:OmpA family protein [Polymorphobacter fuscus]|nr:OmpA family protein [Polymorphobacter fuscus]NJC08367.1 outer membrane protein OmpA-like peptidoglycan-associated protein [Polymorphobacter fuscus]
MAPLVKLVVGVAGTALLASAAYRLVRSPLLSDLGSRTAAVMAANGITDGRAAWVTDDGWTWRIARLSGTADAATRARTLAAVADLPGVGRAVWEDAPAAAPRAPVRTTIDTCQAQVSALLAAQPIAFAAGDPRPAAAADATLAAVARILSTCAGNRVTVTGATPVTGTAASNLALSQARAEAVAVALADRGIDRRRIEAIGRGETGVGDTAMPPAIDIRISKGPAGLRAEETT